MFRIRKHLSYANIVATLALVFSMGGAAVAAQHYLINSTSQISPGVLKQLHGRSGKQGGTGATGERGPQGNVGRPGLPGLAGTLGPMGPTGPAGAGGPSEGSGGVAGATGATGPTGEPGQSQSSTPISEVMKAEDEGSLTPKSAFVAIFGNEKLRVFCGNVPVVSSQVAGVSVEGPVGTLIQSSLAGVNERGEEPEAKVPTGARRVEIGEKERIPAIQSETVSALVTNQKEPKTNMGYMSAVVTQGSQAIYINAFVEVRATEPNCLFHGTAYSLPV